MSDLLKLSTALPGDQEINGLDALAAALVEDPSRMVCAVLILDVKDVRYITDDATARGEAAEQAIRQVREFAERGREFADRTMDDVAAHWARSAADGIIRALDGGE